MHNYYTTPNENIRENRGYIHFFLLFIFAIIVLIVIVPGFAQAQDALQVYDADHNGFIDKSEAIKAIVDYFDGKLPKNDAMGVIMAYFNGGATVHPTPTPTTPTSATGTIFVTSTPAGANATIDGVTKITPAQFDLSGGMTYNVTISMDGYQDAVFQTPVIINGTEMGIDALLAHGGNVNVTSTPAGAKVTIKGLTYFPYFSGIITKTTPASFTLPEGYYDVVISMDGYWNWIENGVFVSANNPLVLDAVLTPIPSCVGNEGCVTGVVVGGIIVGTAPAGAKATIDVNGVNVTKITPAYFILPEGDYNLVVSMDGYPNASTTVHAQNGVTGVYNHDWV